jgi:hypothetical protein
VTGFVLVSPARSRADVDMLDHLDAVRVLLAHTGFDVHLVDVPQTPTYPYVLLWCSPGLLVAETLDGAQTLLDDQLGVTTVADTAEGAFAAAKRVRDALNGRAPDVPGRHTERLELRDARPVAPDRDVTIEATGRHPAFAVDLYRLASSPA